MQTNPIPLNSKHWLTPTEAALYSGISERALWRYMKTENVLPYSQLEPRGKVLIARRDIDAFIVARRAESAGR